MPERLVDVLADPQRRAAVVRDSVRLIEAEVASKSGLRGAAIKTGFKAVKKVRPGILELACDRLLPAFAPAVDPHYAAAVSSGDAVGYFRERAHTIAEALLQVTDARAAQADNGVMKKVYASLRGQALQHTAAAMPAVAEMIGRHVR